MNNRFFQKAGGQRVLYVLLLAVSPLVWPQTADEIESLLASSGVNYAHAARFVLEAADAAVFSDPAAAFTFAKEQNWLPKKAEQNEQARLDGISLLIMRSFHLSGGFFYSIFKNPHYAYRELVYREIIQDRAEPEMAVSGDLLLFMIGRILSITENDAKQQAETEAAKQARAAELQKAAEAEQRRIAQMEAQVKEINAQIAARTITDTTARVTNAGIILTLRNIQFLAESSVLAETEKTKIREIAVILRDIPGKKIRVAGHTALAGDEEGQFQLSYDRARSVAVLLIQMQARGSDDILVQGYGATQPVADNSTPQGMAANRRVEITILED